MGLLDIATSMLGGGQSGASGNVLGNIIQALNNQPGGLEVVLQSLRQGGLGPAVTSWIGNGANAPVSPGDLQSALPGGMLEGMAAKLGIPPDVAASQLSKLLPEIVDHLTPNGEVPQGGMGGAAMSALQGMLAKKFGA